MRGMRSLRVTRLARDQFKQTRYADNTGSDAEYQRNRLRRLALDDYRCTTRGCNQRASTTHHVLPVSKGGSHAVANLRSICKKCHDREHPHLFKRAERSRK